MATNFDTYNTDYNPVTGKKYDGNANWDLPTVDLSKGHAEHMQKVICHEIHRIRYKLSSPWLPIGEKEAIEKELWLLEDIEKEIHDQL